MTSSDVPLPNPSPEPATLFAASVTAAVGPPEPVGRPPVRTAGAVEKGRPTPQAVFGACAVVTDAARRVLLGRSTRGMWELPGGRIEAGRAVHAPGGRGA